MCSPLIRSCQSKFPLMFQSGANAFTLLANIKGKEDGNLTCPFHAASGTSFFPAVTKIPKHLEMCDHFFAQGLRTKLHKGLL